MESYVHPIQGSTLDMLTVAHIALNEGADLTLESKLLKAAPA